MTLLDDIDHNKENQIRIPTKILILEENEYSRNFAAIDGSVVWVEGFPVVHTIKEIYKDNKNWLNWSNSETSLPKPIILEPYKTNKV